MATRLNAPFLTTSNAVYSNFHITSDNAHVVFRGDVVASGRDRAYIVDISAPETSQTELGSFGTSGSLDVFFVDLDASDRVVVRGDLIGNSFNELFLIDAINAPAARTGLNPMFGDTDLTRPRAF